MLTDANAPMTPNEVRARIEARLGEPIASSTVKDCMARHAKESKELRRYKGGRYVWDAAPLDIHDLAGPLHLGHGPE